MLEDFVVQLHADPLDILHLERDFGVSVVPLGLERRDERIEVQEDILGATRQVPKRTTRPVTEARLDDGLAEPLLVLFAGFLLSGTASGGP